ncbi:hypothetical protein D3C75_1108030 [compost metagenome]
MLNRILHNGLKGQLGNRTPLQIRRNPNPEHQPVRIPDLLDMHIIPEDIRFLSQRDDGSLLADGDAQKPGQGLHHLGNIRLAVLPGHPVDGA